MVPGSPPSALAVQFGDVLPVLGAPIDVLDHVTGGPHTWTSRPVHEREPMGSLPASLHVSSQPSSLTLLPSSQSSPCWTILSPHLPCVGPPSSSVPPSGSGSTGTSG